MLMKHFNLVTVGFVTFLLFCTNAVCVNAQHQLTPEFSVEVYPNQYVVHFTLPPYWFVEDDSYEDGEESNYGEDDECGTFLNIELDADYDVTDETNYPELPFFSLDLLLPNDVSNVNCFYDNEQFTEEFIEHYITPALNGGTVDIVGNQCQYTQEDDDPCQFSSAYYQNGVDERFPNGFYRSYCALSGINNYLSSTGVTLSVFPFSYHPELGYINVLTEFDVIIDFDGGDVTQVINDYATSTAYSSLAIVNMYDNFNDMQINTEQYDLAKYLIVASHRDMEPILQRYVEYKSQQNYQVDVLYLDEVYTDEYFNIRFYIEQNGILPEPDYVLLVGSLEDVPAAEYLASYPYSDDLHHPFLGRWIVNGELGHYPDLESIIDKTIDTEQGLFDRNHTCTAVLFSGVDANNRRLSKQLNQNIKKIKQISFDPMGVPATLYDGRQQQIGFHTMVQALGGNPSFFIYSGHGALVQNSTLNYIGSSIDEPYIVSPSNIHFSLYNGTVNNNTIADLHNNSPFPMGFGFSCYLNTYLTNNNFAAKWITESTGGVSFYGATIKSSMSANKSLSKKIFKTFKKMQTDLDNFPLALWLRTAEGKYYNALKNATRYQQTHKYNLMGDPTLYVFGMDYNGEKAHFHAPAKNLNRPINDGDIISVDVFDIYGQLIESHSSLDFLFRSDNSLKIIKITYTDGTIKAYKAL